MQISYDVTDWKTQYDKTGDRPTSLDEAVDLMRESNIKSGELAMLLIIGRELGIVTDDRLPSNKMSNLTGMGLHLARHRSRQTARANVGGTEMDVPRFIAQATVEDGVEGDYAFDVPALSSDVTVVDYSNPEAADRAVAYLMTNVVGRIRDRFKLIALHKPNDVKRIAKELKGRIDEIVKEMT